MGVVRFVLQRRFGGWSCVSDMGLVVGVVFSAWVWFGLCCGVSVVVGLRCWRGCGGCRQCGWRVGKKKRKKILNFFIIF
jgi:hypothetical protein